MKPVNIYITGMGGQGIAFLSRLLLETCINAGYNIKSCDTHGLAQRGGIVVSHLRIGKEVYAPLIPKGKADIVIGLERLEAMRTLKNMIAVNGTIVYYDVVYQPTAVRTGKYQYPSEEEFRELALKKQVRLERVFFDDLKNPKMQNIALLSRIISLDIIPEINHKITLDTMNRLLPDSIKSSNMELYSSLISA